LIQGKQVELKAGQEFLIPKGVPHGSKVLAGTRSIHAFGGRRVTRSQP
jgi:mannose-6-phosphate isomerase-like protein (cupin superfamily)